MKTRISEYIDERTGETVIKTVTRGRAVYSDNGREIVADALTTYDYGKRGVTRIYERYPDISPDENARRLDELRKIGGRILAARAAR